MNTEPNKNDFHASNHRATSPSSEGRVLHRIAEVRLQQGLSDNVLVRRLGIPRKELDRQQSPICDLLLSQLYRWQAALEVPVSELLIDPGHALSPVVGRRAQLVKLMKTVRSLQYAADSNAIRALADQLADQLTGIMPELVDVGGWPIVGQLRAPHDISPLEERLMPDPFPCWTRLPSVDTD
jgi:hypothetical protein